MKKRLLHFFSLKICIYIDKNLCKVGRLEIVIPSVLIFLRVFDRQIGFDNKFKYSFSLFRGIY